MILPLRGFTHTLTITTAWGRLPQTPREGEGAIGLHEVFCQKVNRMEERQAHLSSRDQWRQAEGSLHTGSRGEGQHWAQTVTDTDGVTGAGTELSVPSRARPVAAPLPLQVRPPPVLLPPHTVSTGRPCLRHQIRPLAGGNGEQDITAATWKNPFCSPRLPRTWDTLTLRKHGNHAGDHNPCY